MLKLKGGMDAIVDFWRREMSVQGKSNAIETAENASQRRASAGRR
jgi:hypothetical protein